LQNVSDKDRILLVDEKATNWDQTIDILIQEQGIARTWKGFLREFVMKLFDQVPIGSFQIFRGLALKYVSLKATEVTL
jgi:hypothetical protein